jgi:cysteine desulfurase
MVYLDYASATPLDESVLNAMNPYYINKFYNPSALYLKAKSVKQDIDNARKNVAKIIGAKSSEIIFTAGGTEANNLAISGIMNTFKGSNCVISKIEHESVIAPASIYKCTKLTVNNLGIMEVDKLNNLVDENTVLVSVMLANNEIGTIQPIKELSKQIKNIRTKRQKNGNNLPIYLHTDATQACNYIDLHVSKLGVDLLTLNGGKIYGPKQSGMLFVRTGVKLQSQILGGNQERTLRSGTENVPGIIGFAQALIKTESIKTSEAKRLKELQNCAFEFIAKNLPGVTVNGSLKNRLPNNIHITVDSKDNERMLMELDERGFMCATGSACSASNDKPSHVLSAIGLTDNQARSSLRITLGRQTTKKDMINFLNTLKEVILL